MTPLKKNTQSAILKKKASLDVKKSNSSFSLIRVFNISGAFAVGIFFMVLTMLFATSQLRGEEYGDILRVNGEASIRITGEDVFSVDGNRPLLGGEEIIVTKGDALLRFSNAAYISAKEGTHLTIQQIEPYPIVFFEKGEAWSYGGEKAEIRTKNATFFPRGSSLYIESNGKKISAAAYRHPLFFFAQPSGSTEDVLMTIPAGKKITFSHTSLPSALHSIRYSKLKKEFLLSFAPQNEWITNNIDNDNRRALQSLSNLIESISDSSAPSEFFADIQKALILYPEKFKEIEEIEKKIGKLLYIQNYIFQDGNPLIPLSEASNETLDALIYFMANSPAKKGVATNIALISKEFETRSNIPEASRISATQALLSVFEKNLISRDEKLIYESIDAIIAFWKNEKESPENKKMLEIYREIISNSIAKNMSRITVNIFDFIDVLDEKALSWEQGEEKVITTLEVVERNIETADAFLQKEQFENAHRVIERNKELLKIEVTPRLISSHNNTQKQNELLHSKYLVFQEQGVISNESFHGVLEKRKEAEAVVKDIESVQEMYLQSLAEQEEVAQKTLFEQIRADFWKYKIQILSLDDELKESSEIVKIEDGFFPNGSRFEAEYFIREKVITYISLPQEKIEIKQDIPLANLITVLDSVQAKAAGIEVGKTLEKITEEVSEEWAEKEEDPLEFVDPLVIDISKRFVMTEILRRGYLVNLRDITMLSESTLRVDNLVFPDLLDGNTVSFIYHMTDRHISEIQMNQIEVSVSAQNLDDLNEKTQEAYAKYLALKKEEDRIKWALKSSGCKIDYLEIRRTSSGIHFQNALYNSWNLSGIFDAESDSFVTILESGKIIMSDVPAQDLGMHIFDLWNTAYPKEEEISQK